MKYWFIIYISLNKFYQSCTGSNYNDQYNEIINPNILQQINKDLPKQGKFFDDFDFDCKYIFLKYKLEIYLNII